MEIFINFMSLVILTAVAYVSSQNILKLSPQIYAKGTSANCVVNPNYVQNVSCKLRAVSWEHSVAYFDGDLLGVVRNATIHFESFKYTNQFRPFLINVTFNYCELFAQGLVKNPYIQAIFKVIANYSNVNHKCPYSGHLYLHNAFVDFNYIHFYIPIGTYKLVFIFYEGWPYIHLGTITYIFKIEEKKNAPRTKSETGKTFST